VNPDVIVVTSEGWHWYGADGRSRPIDPFPNLKAPTRLMVAFDNAYIGVMRFEGQAQYAAAFIERQVRQEGWLEGVSHVVLHHLDRVHGGGIAFYTAVRLDAWQQFHDWASRQRDHCLVYPLGALLADIKEGQCRVVRSGCQLRFLARTSEGLFTQDAVAASADLDDIAVAAETLGGDLARQLGADEAPAVEWIALDSASAEDEDWIAQRMAQRAGVAVSCAPLASYQGLEGQVLTALPVCVHQLATREAINKPVDKLAWWQETLAVAAAVAVSALALVFAGMGEYWRQAASEERAQAQGQLQQLRQLRSQFQKTELRAQRKALRAADEFVGPMVDRAPFAPARLLGDVEAARSEGLRIHRVLLDGGNNEPGEDGGQGSDEDGYYVIVDGQNLAGGRDAMRQFLKNLRAQGWRIQPLEPAANAPGSFSYELTRVGERA